MLESLLVFGAFAPSAKDLAILRLVRTGLMRGGISRMARAAWIRRHAGPVDVEVRGLRYRLNPADNITDGKIFLSSKVHDGRELAALSLACAGGTFVDVGANIGYYTLNVARAGARRVIAVEPNPTTLERLRFNVSCNAVGERIEIVPAAVGPRGTATLHLDRSNLGEASLLARSDPSAGTVQVPSQPLLEMLSERKVERVDALKIDIEGYEHAALHPYLAAAPEAMKPRCMVVEHCHDGASAGGGGAVRSDLMELLMGHGYRVSARVRKNTILHRH